MRIWRHAAGLLALLVAHATAQSQVPFAARFEEIKQQATPEQLYRFLWTLPKGGDLHNHHAFSVRPEDWLQLATNPRGNVYYTRVHLGDCEGDNSTRLLHVTIRRSAYRQLSDCAKRDFVTLTSLDTAGREAWLSSMRLDQPDEGRDEFFERIVPRLTPLSYDAQIMPELLIRQMRQAQAEGVRYLEIQADPRVLHPTDDSTLSWKDAAQLYRKRLAAPDALATGVAVRLQVAVVRFSDQAEQNLARAYGFVHQNRDLWVGVNLVGREDNPNGKAPRFLDTFRDLRRRYFDIPLSLHAGESEFADHQVRDTLLLGASRIGHGTNLIRDPDTMLLLRGNRFLVEVSLVSNQLLEYAPDVDRHPFPEYLRLGIPVCLNTDDRGALDSSMTDEYFLAVKHFNLSWPEIVQIGRDSLRYSFAEPALKEKLLVDYDRAVAAFAQKYNRADWARLLESVSPNHSGYSHRKLAL